MANVLGELFGDIAGAIREKTGDEETMKPAEFPQKIKEIEAGGGGTLPAGAYWEYGIYGTPNHYYQTWFLYKGELYAITAKNSSPMNTFIVFKYVNGDWTSILDTEVYAFNTPIKTFLEYNGKIHFFGAEMSRHFTFDGSAVAEMAQLPGNVVTGAAFIQDGKIKVRASNNICVWDEATDTWVSEATVGTSSASYWFAAIGNDVYAVRLAKIYKYENGVMTEVATIESGYYNITAHNSCLYLHKQLNNSAKRCAQWCKFDPKDNTVTTFYGPKTAKTCTIASIGENLVMVNVYPDYSFSNAAVLREVTE